MRVQLCQSLIGLLLLASGPAGAEEITFHVTPGSFWQGNQRQFSDSLQVDGQSPSLAPIQDAPELSLFSFDASPGPHHLVVTRPHFDPLDLQVTWDPQGRQWRFGEPGQPPGILEPGHTFSLSKTVTLNVRPADFEVYIDAGKVNRGSEEVKNETVTIDGVVHGVVPLPQRGTTVTVPHAWNAPRLILTRPWFQPMQLQFTEHELDAEPTVVPVTPRSFVPLYGAFSYQSFDSAAALIVLALAAGVAWWIPESRRRRHERTLVATIQSGRDSVAASMTLSALAEQSVTTELGRRYLLLNLLGQGGMGAVYRAVPIDSGEAEHAVAIKVLVSDSDTNRQRFLREARICQTLIHPSIVKVIDYGEWEAGKGRTMLFMVMELISGRTLQQVMDEFAGPVPYGQAVHWLIEALNGLRVAHAAGIVHRDIKPENLMITQSDHVKIMDFGVAHDAGDTRLTQSEATMGTPLYMSPEHFKAHTVTAASDIYSLGMVGYEMLAGRLPFEDVGPSAWSVLSRVMAEDPPDLREFNPQVPAVVANTVMNMIARDPAERCRDALDRLQAI